MANTYEEYLKQASGSAYARAPGADSGGSSASQKAYRAYPAAQRKTAPAAQRAAGMPAVVNSTAAVSNKKKVYSAAMRSEAEELEEYHKRYHPEVSIKDINSIVGEFRQNQTKFREQLAFENYGLTRYGTNVTPEEVQVIRKQWEYNQARVEKGESELYFPHAAYDPNQYDDDTNSAMTAWIKSYGRGPYETELDAFNGYVQEYRTQRVESELTNKYKLVGMTYKKGSLQDITYDARIWQQYGYTYDKTDAEDVQREALGLPPAAFLAQYTGSENSGRLEAGQLPVKLQVTETAKQQAGEFYTKAMQQIKQGTATEESLRALYGQYTALGALDQYAQQSLRDEEEAQETARQDAYANFLKTGQTEYTAPDTAPARLDILRDYGYKDGSGFAGLLEEMIAAAKYPAVGTGRAEAGQGTVNAEDYIAATVREYDDAIGAADAVTTDYAARYDAGWTEETALQPGQLTAMLTESQAAQSVAQTLRSEKAAFEKYDVPVLRELPQITSAEGIQAAQKGLESDTNPLKDKMQYVGQQPEEGELRRMFEKVYNSGAGVIPVVNAADVLIDMGADQAAIERYAINYLSSYQFDAINYYYGKGDTKRAQELYDYYFEQARQLCAADLIQKTTDIKIEDSDGFLERSKKRALAAESAIMRNTLAAPMQALHTVGNTGYNVLAGKNNATPTTGISAALDRAAGEKEASLEKLAEPLQIAGEMGYMIAENLPQYAISMVSPQAAAAYTALSGMGQASYEAKQRGATGYQQYGYSAVAGMSEYLTEKLPLDSFADLLSSKSGVDSIWRTVAKSAGTEFGEEFVNAYVNTLADNWVMGGKAQYNQYIKQLVGEGKSYSEAKSMADREFFVKQPVQAGLAGAFAGGVMGGTVAAAQTAGAKAAAHGAETTAQTQTAADEELYAIKTIGDKQYVQADRQVIQGNDPNQWRKQIYDYINNTIRKGEDVVVYAADGDALTITEDTAGKARFRNEVRGKNGAKRLLTDEEFAVKLRAEGHIDELAEASIRGKEDFPDTKNHPFAKDGFNYRTAYFADKTGYYRLTLSVGKNGTVNTVYNVGKIEEARFPGPLKGMGAQRPKGNQASVSQTIAQPLQTVNESTERLPVRSEVEELTEADRAAVTAQQKHAMNSVEALSKRLGVQVHWVKAIHTYAANGEAVGDAAGISNREKRSITLSIKGGKADMLAGIAAHELTHQLEGSGAYEEFRGYVLQQMKDAGKYEDMLQRYTGVYNTQDAAYLENEMVADFVRDDLFHDERSIRRFVNEHRGIVGKVLNAFDTLLTRIKGLPTATKEVQRARELWAKAYAAGERGEMQAVGETQQYSKALGGYVPEMEASTKGVTEEYGITDINNRNEVINKVAAHLATQYLSTEAQSKPVVNIDTGMRIEIWKSGIKETFGKDSYYRRLSQQEKVAKLASMKHLAKLIKYGEVRAPEAGNYHDPTSEVTYAYLKAPLTIDGAGYLVSMDIRKSPRHGNRFYIHKLEVQTDGSNNKKGSDYLPPDGNPRERITDNHSSDNKISQTDIAVNTSISPATENDTAERTSPMAGNEMLREYGLDAQRDAERREQYERRQRVQRMHSTAAQAAEETPPQPETEREYTVNRLGSAETEGMSFSGKGHALEVLRRNARGFMSRVKQDMGINRFANAEQLETAVAQMYYEVMDTGSISQETLDMAADDFMTLGRVINTDFYEAHKDLLAELRTTPIKLGSYFEDAGGADLKKRMFGRLNFTRSGTADGRGVAIDRLWQDLNQRYGELFPADVTNPAEQATYLADFVQSVKPVESSAADTYTDPAEAAYLHQRFEEAAAEYAGQVRSFKELLAEQSRRHDPNGELTREQVEYSAAQARAATRQYEKLKRTRQITERTAALAQDMVAGNITEEDLQRILPDAVQRDTVAQLAQIKRTKAEAAEQRSRYAKRARTAAEDTVRGIVETSGTWNRAVGGTLKFAANTAERNMRSVMPANVAEQAVKKLIRPIQKAAGDNVQWLKGYKARVSALHLNTAESKMVQLLGEGLVTAQDLQNIDADAVMRAAKAQELWGIDGGTARLAKYVREGALTRKDLQRVYDTDRLQGAVREFRAIYEELFDDINAVYERWGYEPMPHRANYFPHFMDDSGDNWLQKAAVKLGLGVGDELTTELAGNTADRRPGRQWNQFALQRTGEKTAYDALKGMDKYLDVAGKVIHQTDNIQRLRVFERALRYEWSDAAVKDRVDELRRADIDPAEKDAQIQAQLEGAQKGQKLGAFVTWLRDYTNILAGKTSALDRSMEDLFGRKFFRLGKAITGRAAANMVGANVGSAMTQFIPIQQGLAAVDSECAVKGIIETLKHIPQSDGFRQQSDFLRAREGVTMLSRTATQKVSDALGGLQSFVDMFSCEVVTRAKYYEGIKRGLTQRDAMERADAHARGVIAGRAQGDQPILFESKNPLLRTALQFQLEQVNQYEYLFKDLPRDAAEKGGDSRAKAAAQLVGSLAKYVLGAYIAGLLYKALLGRDPTLNPLGEAENAIRAIRDTDTDIWEDIETISKSVAEDIPVVGGYLGGGRIVPITSTFGDVGAAAKAVGTQLFGPEEDKMDAETLIHKVYNGVAGPLYYYLPPVGGGQIKKTVEGINVVARGGAYQQSAQGEKLQYTVEQTPGNLIKAAVLGRSSLPETRAYYDGGGKPLSAKLTGYYEQAVDMGMEPEQFMQLVDAEKKVEASKYSDGTTIPLSKGRKVKKLIDEAGLTRQQTQLLYEAFAVPESLWK